MFRSTAQNQLRLMVIGEVGVGKSGEIKILISFLFFLKKLFIS